MDENLKSDDSFVSHKNEEVNQNSEAKELEADIEKDLCDLWDMSVEKDVCLVLDELNSIEIFDGYIRKFYQVGIRN